MRNWMFVLCCLRGSASPNPCQPSMFNVCDHLKSIYNEHKIELKTMAMWKTSQYRTRAFELIDQRGVYIYLVRFAVILFISFTDNYFPLKLYVHNLKPVYRDTAIHEEKVANFLESENSSWKSNHCGTYICVNSSDGRTFLPWTANTMYISSDGGYFLTLYCVNGGHTELVVYFILVSMYFLLFLLIFHRTWTCHSLFSGQKEQIQCIIIIFIY